MKVHAAAEDSRYDFARTLCGAYVISKDWHRYVLIGGFGSPGVEEIDCDRCLRAIAKGREIARAAGVAR